MLNVSLTQALSFFKEKFMGYQHINVLIPAEIYTLLREYCNKHNRKISDVVRMGIFQILGISRPSNLRVTENEQARN